MRTRRGRKDHVRTLLTTAALIGLTSLGGTGSDASRANAAGPVFRPGSWFSKTLHKLRGDQSTLPTAPPVEPPGTPSTNPSAAPAASPAAEESGASPAATVPMPPPPVPGMDPFESIPETSATPGVFRPISNMREISDPGAASVPVSDSALPAFDTTAAPASEGPEAADLDADVPFLDFNAPLPKRTTEPAPSAAASGSTAQSATPSTTQPTAQSTTPPPGALPATLPRVPASTAAAAAATQVHQGGKIASFDLMGGTLVLDLAPDMTLEPGTKLLVYHRFNLGRVSTVCEIVVRSSEPGTALAQPLAPSAFSRMAIGDTAIVIP